MKYFVLDDPFSYDAGTDTTVLGEMPFDGYINLVNVRVTENCRGAFYAQFHSSQFDILEEGVGDSGEFKYVGGFPLPKGASLIIYTNATTAGTGTVKIYGSDMPGGGFKQALLNEFDKIGPSLKLVTTTATVGGAINADFGPATSGEIWRINHPIEVMHHDDTGAAGRDVIISFYDGSSAYEIETKAALAEDTWSVVDFVTAFPEIKFPYDLSNSWKIRATVTAGAADDTINIRGVRKELWS